MIDEKNVSEIRSLYEHGFPDLTERFFQQRLWPSEETVENIVGSGELFLAQVIALLGFYL